MVFFSSMSPGKTPLRALQLLGREWLLVEFFLKGLSAYFACKTLVSCAAADVIGRMRIGPATGSGVGLPQGRAR